MSVVHTRTPLRISLGGGGTDLPSFYSEHGGFVVSAAIDKYVHVVAGTAFRDRYLLKHLEWEEVDDPAHVRHPILRAALMHHWEGRPLELASVADAPAGTGLGSSGSYAVGVLAALARLRGEEPDAAAIAAAACHLEIDLVGRTVGKQDQYAAAHGGANAWTFGRDGGVSRRALELPAATLEALEENFLLFYTGVKRSASGALADQVRRTLAGEADIAANLTRTKEIAVHSCAALEAGDLAGLAPLINEQWDCKLARVPAMSAGPIPELRDFA
ncbi:MAG: galactokinase, partial [Thermoleophilaceae bacterium]|nr:galactokinase [Thermoleophilaceae bacterium]